MSTPPPYPYPQQYPQPYPQYPVPPPKRRSALPWVIGGAAVVAAALTVTLVLVLSGDSAEDYDLSTPEKAAEAIGAAAEAGDVDVFLGLTCVGTPECMEKYGDGATEAEIAGARDRLANGISSMKLTGATFGKATKGSEPGVMEVPYTLPNSDPNELHGLTFVRIDGRWLWYGSFAGGGGIGGDGGGGQDGNQPPPASTPEEEPTTVSCPPPPAPPTPGVPSNPFPTQPPIEGC